VGEGLEVGPAPQEVITAPVPRGRLAALLGAMVLLWAVNFVIGKVALREFPVFTAAFLRLVISAVLLWPIVLLSGARADLPDLRRAWRKLAWLSFFGVLCNQLFFIAGLKYTSVAHSSIIVALTPVFTLLVASLRGQERITALRLAGLAASIAGVAVLATARAGGGATGPSLLGDFFAALSCFSFALFAVLGKEITHHFSPISLNAAGYTLGMFMMLPVAARELWQGSAAGASPQAWLALAYMAVGASVIAYIIFYWALRHTAASKVTSLSYIQPVLVTVLGVIFLRERLTAAEVGGAAVVLGGVYLTQKS
jgi:drug/metabolite transporter (DMT)-like permease